MNGAARRASSSATAALATVFVIVTMVSEGALLFVAAQAGFVDGPRVMANMALDQWMPHRMAALSEQLTMRNGVYLMAAAAALVLRLHAAARSTRSSSCTASTCSSRSRCRTSR